MAMRIAFIKALFPKPFEDLDYSTLKNLKAKWLEAVSDEEYNKIK
jgi:hypothetical protein